MDHGEIVTVRHIAVEALHPTLLKLGVTGVFLIILSVAVHWFLHRNTTFRSEENRAQQRAEVFAAGTAVTGILFLALLAPWAKTQVNVNQQKITVAESIQRSIEEEYSVKLLSASGGSNSPWRTAGSLGSFLGQNNTDSFNGGEQQSIVLLDRTHKEHYCIYNPVKGSATVEKYYVQCIGKDFPALVPGKPLK